MIRVGSIANTGAISVWARQACDSLGGERNIVDYLVAIAFFATKDNPVSVPTIDCPFLN